MDVFFAHVVLSDGWIANTLLDVLVFVTAALVCALASYVAARSFRRDRLAVYTLYASGLIAFSFFALCFMLIFSSDFTRVIRHHVKDAYAGVYVHKAVELLMADIHDQRVFSTIFRYHPEAEAELTDIMTNVVYNVADYSNTPIHYQIRSHLQAAGSATVSRYFKEHLPYAPTPHVYSYLKKVLHNLRRFDSNNELCASYFSSAILHTPLSSYTFPVEFVQQERDVTAEMIESAIKSPSVPPAQWSEDAVVTLLSQQYQEMGYSPEHLEELPYLSGSQDERVCAFAIEFIDALASLDAEEAAALFKNLVGEP